MIQDSRRISSAKPAVEDRGVRPEFVVRMGLLKGDFVGRRDRVGRFLARDLDGEGAFDARRGDLSLGYAAMRQFTISLQKTNMGKLSV